MLWNEELSTCPPFPFELSFGAAIIEEQQATLNMVDALDLPPALQNLLDGLNRSVPLRVSMQYGH